MTFDGLPRVALFGDECGLPLMLRSLNGIRPAMLVYDPRRETVKTWIGRSPANLDVQAHPTPAGRSDFEAKVRSVSPSLGIVASYSRILWPELISIFPLGVVNVHGGRLPEYRGANVLQWAIINGESDTAATLHYVDKGVDTGPVIAELPVTIESDDTAVEVRAKLSMASAKLLIEWIPRLIRKKVPAAPQNEERARTWPRRIPEDGIIDWSWPDEQIRNISRSLVKPWPSPFYYDSAGTKVVIDRILSLDEVTALRQEASG